ncbi:MAG: hypothetical protein HFE86_07815 [Clostridiales bacterium]|nr:hypothetical protein [Clostridiales bacterium]
MRLPRILPGENFLLSSDKTPAQVAALLREQADACSPALRPYSPKRFWGQVSEGGFKLCVKRDLPLSDLGIPRAYGRIYASGTGSVLQIRLRLPLAVRACVSVFWLALAFAFGYIFWRLCADLLTAGPSDWQLGGVPVIFGFLGGMAAVLWVLPRIDYWRWAPKIRLSFMDWLG